MPRARGGHRRRARTLRGRTIWLWTFERAGEVGPDSDVYLNLPQQDPLLLWHLLLVPLPSARIDAGDTPIKRSASHLQRGGSSNPSEFESVCVDLGYEYVVTSRPEDGNGSRPAAGRAGNGSVALMYLRVLLSVLAVPLIGAATLALIPRAEPAVESPRLKLGLCLGARASSY